MMLYSNLIYYLNIRIMYNNSKTIKRYAVAIHQLLVPSLTSAIESMNMSISATVFNVSAPVTRSLCVCVCVRVCVCVISGERVKNKHGKMSH